MIAEEGSIDQQHVQRVFLNHNFWFQQQGALATQATDLKQFDEDTENDISARNFDPEDGEITLENIDYDDIDFSEQIFIQKITFANAATASGLLCQV